MRSRFFQPHNGMRVDAIRDEIERLDLDPVERGLLLTSLLEAADRVDSHLRPADGLRQAVGGALATKRSSCASRPRSPGRPGRSAGCDAEALAADAGRRRLRLPRPALQPALLLLQLPRVGDPRALGRARALRRRLQARGLPDDQERLQLAAARVVGAGAAGRAAARRRGCSSPSATRASTTPATSPRCSPRRATCAPLAVDVKRYVGAQIGIHNPRRRARRHGLAPAQHRAAVRRRAGRGAGRGRRLGRNLSGSVHVGDSVTRSMPLLARHAACLVCLAALAVPAVASAAPPWSPPAPLGSAPPLTGQPALTTNAQGLGLAVADSGGASAPGPRSRASVFTGGAFGGAVESHSLRRVDGTGLRSGRRLRSDPADRRRRQRPRPRPSARSSPSAGSRPARRRWTRRAPSARAACTPIA